MEPAAVAATDTPNLVQVEFSEIGKKRLDAITAIQKEILEDFAERNQAWFHRATAEMKLASELGASLTAARSVPDAMAAYRQYLAKRMERLGEDMRQWIGDTQRCMDATRRLLANGETGPRS